ALYRKVKKELNISPSNYIQKIRLEIAKQLLDKKSITVSEIAYASGFESLSYFSKSFKNKYGHKPSSISANSH
ncbi:MAG TPA: AraC family transcriptional regulator, partial [Oceanospirillales bacterium]|nr:AraC family transcriptional regulator [Oceanospirillales bacterium]